MPTHRADHHVVLGNEQVDLRFAVAVIENVAAVELVFGGDPVLIAEMRVTVDEREFLSPLANHFR
jgi:hypothetical protein